jgi:hypothetical protein
MSTTTLATPDRKRHPLAAGEYVTYGAGDVLITLQCVRPGAAYTITCYRRSLRLDDNCTTAETEDLARTIARGYAVMFLQEAS